MSTNIGLWIDHRTAIVVALTDHGEEIKRMTSEIATQARRAGDSPLTGDYEPQQVPADDSHQRAITKDLNSYYDAVITRIRKAESILLFGPGEAKHELNKRLIAQQLGGRVAGVETVDKMTDRQIAAKVRDYFAA